MRHPVIFNGFEVGFGSNEIWASLPANSWDFTIAPWVLLGLCGTLIVPDVDLLKGRAPIWQEQEKSKNLFMRGWVWILNQI